MIARQPNSDKLGGIDRSRVMEGKHVSKGFVPGLLLGVVIGLVLGKLGHIAINQVLGVFLSLLFWGFCLTLLAGGIAGLIQRQRQSS